MEHTHINIYLMDVRNLDCASRRSRSTCSEHDWIERIPPANRLASTTPTTANCLLSVV